MGNDNYPNTPTEVYNLLVNYKNYNGKKRNTPPEGLYQVVFVTTGKKLKRDDTGESSEVKPKKDQSKLMCFNCLQYGHYKSECQNSDPRQQRETHTATATTLMTREGILTMNKEEAIDHMWMDP
jgi:hypothetical protein